MGKAVTGLNKPNTTSNFYPFDDLWRMVSVPMKASTAMVEGAAVAVEVSVSSPTGYATLAAATNTTGQNIIGILAEPIVSTDADYATAGKLKQVWIPTTTQAKAYFTVGAGTFTAADVGRVCSIHTDSKSLAVDTNGLGAEITDFISSTRGVCRFSVPKAVTA